MGAKEGVVPRPRICRLVPGFLFWIKLSLFPKVAHHD